MKLSRNIVRPGTLPHGFRPALEQENTDESARPISTVEELEAAFPEQVAAIRKKAAESAAVISERNRLRELDSLACIYGSDAIEGAKYGQNKCTAQELAYREAIRKTHAGNQFLSDLMEDFNDSGVRSICPAFVPDEETIDGENDGYIENAAKYAVQKFLQKEKEHE